MFQLDTFISDESTDLGESSWLVRLFSSCASFFNNNRLVELVTGGTTVSNRDKRSRNSWSVMNSPIAPATVHRITGVPIRNGQTAGGKETPSRADECRERTLKIIDVHSLRSDGVRGGDGSLWSERSGRRHQTDSVEERGRCSPEITDERRRRGAGRSAGLGRETTGGGGRRSPLLCLTYTRLHLYPAKIPLF